MSNDCRFCGCELFEQSSGCGCKCHIALSKLLESNGGSKSQTIRDLMEEVGRQTDDRLHKPFKIPGVGIGIPVTLDDLTKLFEQLGDKDTEVLFGDAQGEADPYKMSVPDLIKHQVYTGIKEGKLQNGFILDRVAFTELNKVLDMIEPAKRVYSCIMYLVGYDRGRRFSKIREEYKTW